MLDILTITAPIFLLIGIGYLARWRGLLSPVQLSGVGTFVLYFSLPALVIKALTQSPLEDVINAHFLLAYGMGSLITLALVLYAARHFMRKPLGEAAIQALGMSASNSGFIGYPVAALVLGPVAAGKFLAMCMMVENLLIIPGALILAEAGQQRDVSAGVLVRHTLQRLARNPIMIGLAFGLTVAISGISLPSPIERVIEMLASASAPAALFVIGGTLYGLKLGGMWRDIVTIASGKLLLHPLLIISCFLALTLVVPDLDVMLLAGALLFASCPMISVYPLLGARFNMEGVGSAALMVSTLGSFITLSAAIWLVNQHLLN
ncbi:AEC family transporter [Halomonas huangheensis]|uniref:Permease n=1 Tax=Halomonas huangheensis TaxID=1178482 RepID=W1NA97_9GAMM|nr:AEC family transporter [Halomonas huangheensis]ALM53914.1 permease [Halomonas huangheensis]ERL52136.1 hypothetical protein BJB45_09225 [Halomonas huangheensis]